MPQSPLPDSTASSAPRAQRGTQRAGKAQSAGKPGSTDEASSPKPPSDEPTRPRPKRRTQGEFRPSSVALAEREAPIRSRDTAAPTAADARAVDETAVDETGIGQAVIGDPAIERTEVGDATDSTTAERAPTATASPTGRMESAAPARAADGNAVDADSDAGANTGGDSVPAGVAGREDPGIHTVDRKRVRLLVGLAVAAVLLVAASVLLAVAAFTARESGPLANQAFVDNAATAEVVGQVTHDITIVYSYNYTTLPADEAAANAVITGKFADEFARVFEPVKQLAPQEQAVLKSSVPAAGVLQLQGDRARLLMMVDQAGVRGTDKQPTGATARLIVDAQKVDGQWKIAGVTPE